MADSVAIAEGNLVIKDSLVAIRDILKDDLNKDNRKYPFNINNLSKIPNTDEEYKIWTGYVDDTKNNQDGQDSKCTLNMVYL